MFFKYHICNCLKLLVTEEHKVKVSQWELRVNGEYWISTDMMCVTHTSCSHAGHSNSQDKYQWLWTERMASIDLTIGVIFLMQMVLGIPGNFSLLCHHIILHFTGSRLKFTDLILKHLTVANSLILLCKGVPQTMAVFGWKHMCSDFGCKLLFFLQSGEGSVLQ